MLVLSRSSVVPVCVYTGKSVWAHGKLLQISGFYLCAALALIAQHRITQTFFSPVKVPVFVVVSMEIFSLRRVLRQTGLGLFSSAGVRGHILLSLWTDAESASFPPGSRPRWVKSMFILVQLICTRSVPCMLEIRFFFFLREQENRISTF